MDFFYSLSLDIRVLVVCGLGAAVLAVFTPDKKKEKRYILAFTVLMFVTLVRFNHATATAAEKPATQTAAVAG